MCSICLNILDKMFLLTICIIYFIKRAIYIKPNIMLRNRNFYIAYNLIIFP